MAKTTIDTYPRAQIAFSTIERVNTRLSETRGKRNRWAVGETVAIIAGLGLGFLALNNPNGAQEVAEGIKSALPLIDHASTQTVEGALAIVAFGRALWNNWAITGQYGFNEKINSNKKWLKEHGQVNQRQMTAETPEAATLSETDIQQWGDRIGDSAQDTYNEVSSKRQSLRHNIDEETAFGQRSRGQKGERNKVRLYMSADKRGSQFKYSHYSVDLSPVKYTKQRGRPTELPVNEPASRIVVYKDELNNDMHISITMSGSQKTLAAHIRGKKSAWEVKFNSSKAFYNNDRLTPEEKTMLIYNLRDGLSVARELAKGRKSRFASKTDGIETLAGY